MILKKKISFVSTICCFSLASSMLTALPQDAEVSMGSAKISQKAHTMTIEASDKAIINYSDFSVAKREKVQFVQPDKNAVVLNRVTGENVSDILGKVESNGQVFLVNPNGVYFGPKSEVNVGSLFASTLDISNQDFYAGNFAFHLGEGQGSIINEGQINVAQGGVVAFISPVSVNEGSIHAEEGTVYFAAGEKVQVDFSGDGLVSFVVDGAIANASITQAGSIVAHAVKMEVSSIDNVLKDVVNMRGFSEGAQIVRRNGEIMITGESDIQANQVMVAGSKGTVVSVDGQMKLDTENSHLEIKGDSLSLRKIAVTSKQGSGDILFSSVGENGVIQIEDGAFLVAPENFSLAFSTTNGQAIYFGDQSEVATVGKDISFHSPIVLAGNNARIHTNGLSGDVYFAEPISGSSANSALSIDAGQGSIRFEAPLGEKSSLGQLELSAGSLTLPALVVTKGKDVLISSATHFNQDLKIDTTGQGRFSGGNLLFKGQNSSIDGNFKFVADVGSGHTFFEGPVGSKSSLQRFHVKAAHSTISSDVKASGGTIIYDSPVTISGTVTMTDLGPTGIAFLSTVDATAADTDALTLNALMGRVLFAGVVGGTTPLTDLTVSSNTIEQMAAVTVTDDTAITGASSVTYTAPGGITLAGNITATSTVTTANITLNNPITVVEAVTLTSTPTTTGTIIVSGANGPGSLTLTGATTNTFQNAPVTDLAFLSVTGNALASTVAFNAGADVNVIGDITVAGGAAGIDATIACNTLNTQGGDITMSSNVGNITASALNSVNTNGGDFIASVTADTLNFASSFNLGGGDFTLVAAGGAGSVTTLSGNLNTGGGNATIGGAGNETVTLSGDSIYTYGGDLTVNASGGGALGTTNSANINLGGGTATFTGPYIQSASAPTLVSGNGTFNFGGAITLSGDMNIDVGAGSLAFSSTINGANELFITGKDASTVTIGGVVGGTTPPSFIVVTAGIITQSADVTYGTGDLIYNGNINLEANITGGATPGSVVINGPLALGADVAITTNGTTAIGADIFFNSSINSNGAAVPRALTVNAGTEGIIMLSGDVGELYSLNTAALTASEIQVGASITTAGAQTYNSPVFLIGDSYFSSGAGVTVASTLNGYHSLSIEATGAVALQGVVGGTLPLRLFNVNGSSISVAGNVTTHP